MTIFDARRRTTPWLAAATLVTAAALAACTSSTTPSTTPPASTTPSASSVLAPVTSSPADTAASSSGPASSDSSSGSLTSGSPTTAGPTTDSSLTSSSAPSGAASGATTTSTYSGPQVEKIKKVMQSAMTEDKLRGLIVRVTVDGKDIYTGALGESLPGVPADPAMHFRNGAFAYSYLGQLLVVLADRGDLTLDDKLSEYLPDLPQADQITLKMLANSTAGYADYVYTPEMIKTVYLDPQQQFSTDDLIRIGTSEPMSFEPGTNWGYSHTNYAVLSKALETATGQPMPELMRTLIFEPMGLKNTNSSATPDMPSPVIHSYSSERREDLKIPAGIPFYEDSTYWNPSWTGAEGVVQYTDIVDLTTSAEAIGTGKLVSPRMHQEQVGNNLVGKGARTDRCPVCGTLSQDLGYGFALVLLNGWITQTKDFAGAAASFGYLPDAKIAIATMTTYLPGKFDATGSAQGGSSKDVMADLATAVAPDSRPPG